MVGLAKPVQRRGQHLAGRAIEQLLIEAPRTLGDLLAAVDLGNLILKQLVALLADFNDLGARDAELGNLGKHLLRDLCSGLVLGESVRVVEGVVCK